MLDFLFKIFYLAIVIINNMKTCDNLPNGCRFEEAYGPWSIRYETFICDSLNRSFVVSDGEKTFCKKTPTSLTEVYFKLWPSQILDRSLNFTSIEKFLRDMNRFNHDDRNVTTLKFRFSNLKGFDLNSSFSIDYSLSTNYTINYLFEIHDSEFQFFFNDRLKVSCKDFFEPKSFFQMNLNKSLIEMNFYYFKTSKSPICPLYFKNMTIYRLSFNYQINTFYKKNYLKFYRNNNTDMNFLNANVDELWTYNNVKIDIDSNSFIDKYVFHNVKKLAIFGEINSIEKGIFKSFKQLRNVYLDIIFFGKLSRKGTEWISSINFDLHVNISNKSEFDLNMNKTRMIHLSAMTITNLVKEAITGSIFQDEDFCLFQNYPFHQLVLTNVRLLRKWFNPKYTCTIQWVLRYVYLYDKNFLIKGYSYDYYSFSDFLTSSKDKKSERLQKCDFVKMLENCNRTKFNIRKNNEWTINDSREISIIIEFICILLLPIVCFIGVLSNLLIIYTLSIKDNKTDLGLVHYSYLKMVSASSIVVIIINMLSLIYECQPYQGIYCSSFHKSLFSQYYKIIFSEFLCTMFKMISNFSYVGFSISRLSLIGKNHSKLIVFISELHMSYYIIASTLISVALSLVKIFRYQVNRFDPIQEYPIPFDQNFNNIYSSNFETKARLVNIFNAVADLTNYLVFIVINIILDIWLVVKLNRTLSEKMKSDAAKSSEAVFRVIILVVSFAIFSVVLKLPASLKSVLDSIHLNIDFTKTFAYTHFDYLYQSFCLYARFCLTYDKLASILFIISISANISFYYLFDNNFKFGLKIAINRLITNKDSHLEYLRELENIKAKR